MHLHEDSQGFKLLFFIEHHAVDPKIEGTFSLAGIDLKGDIFQVEALVLQPRCLQVCVQHALPIVKMSF